MIDIEYDEGWIKINKTDEVYSLRLTSSLDESLATELEALTGTKKGTNDKFDYKILNIAKQQLEDEHNKETLNEMELYQLILREINELETGEENDFL